MPILNSYSYLFPYLVITLFSWATYWHVIKNGGFVSDDHAGLGEYDGKLQSWEYGTIWRWIRYHIVGGNYPSGQKDQNGHPIPQGKVPARHHTISIFVLNLTSLVTYIALKPIIGDKVALLSVLLLIVHPCTTQGVAWISGLAYPLSLLWISVTLILMQFFYAHQTLNQAIWVIPAFCLIQFLAIHAIFATTAMTWALLLFLGYWQFAILAAVLSFVMCFDQIRKTVSFRIQEFKKQHMEQSTVFGPRKAIVAMKTFYYYVKHSLAPIRMGLYHTWGFHYEKTIELADGMFWKGFSLFCLLGWGFFNIDCLQIKLAILWYIVFSVGFWNLITAQQFITERYIMVANLGLGIAIAYLTQNYLWVYTFILGLYLCRTWTFLPTYDNELRFYQSNVWNFENSEVAYGNLGVTYARVGMEASAKDSWMIAARINPDYDVPWVNIFYQYRSKGSVMINNGDYIGGLKQFQEGLPYLEKALSAKVCHFPEQWKKEYTDLANTIRQPGGILQDELKRLLALQNGFKLRLSRASDPKDIQGIMDSIRDTNAQMDRLVAFFESNRFVPSDIIPFNVYHTNRQLDKLTRG